MKILYITDSGLDYLADQLYTGLCKLLGWENVIDFPYKAYYHDPLRRAHYLPQNAGRRYDRGEVIELLQSHGIDLAVLSSPRRQAVETLDSLSRHARFPALALVDGEDDRTVRRTLFERYPFGLYFKREMAPVAAMGSGEALYRRLFPTPDLRQRIHPLPFSVVLETVPSVRQADKDVDVSYAGRVSHPKRVRAVAMLRGDPTLRFAGGLYADRTDRLSKLAAGPMSKFLAKLKGDPYVGDTERGKRLSPNDYYGLLNRSKMALSIRGGGFDTLRYWEIVASNTMLISERPDIVIPDNFIDREHAVFCRPDLRDLTELVRYYAAHDRERESIAARGHAHLLAFHTCERRAEYFMRTCQAAL